MLKRLGRNSKFAPSLPAVPLPPGAILIGLLGLGPAALLGAWLGLNIFKRLSDRQFELAVCGLLTVSGVGLVV